VWSLCELIGQAKLSEVEGVTLTGGDKEGAPRRGLHAAKDWPIGCEKKDEKEKKGSPIERAGKTILGFRYFLSLRSVQVATSTS
jgi:hypothetical protein